MTRRMDAPSDAPGPGHNQLSPAERKQTIQDVISDYQAIDDERREFNAKMTKRRNAINGVVRSQLGYTVKVFKAEFIETNAEKNDFENQEAWEMRLAAKAEAAQFLELGEQTDFLAALGVTGVSKSPKKKTALKSKNGAKGHAAEKPEDEDVEITDTMAAAGEKGLEAGSKGESFDTNPYAEGTRHHQAWASKWRAGQEKIASGIGKTPSSAPATTH